MVLKESEVRLGELVNIYRLRAALRVLVARITSRWSRPAYNA